MLKEDHEIVTMGKETLPEMLEDWGRTAIVMLIGLG